ncbi:hypothetical protein BJF83_11265 [Nocardiopsis sp. CNR-923]|uniref:DUF1707 and DUF4870 domain-containing protein n=1 Tax=Nocardiopsis sp. CNR-923 TaxID=1904965 RepID=UPI00095983A3|nr:DUF1707 and DUF4870 domain-containing protein [Nocardiopsis sp. CNR-923]OLT29482.1 hypothetical protein BJF83_11265 [Nocardiopsis sp. CNR-923]
MAVRDRRQPTRRHQEQPQVRLTHADRDAVAEILREAYSVGQLDEQEFDERLDHAMRARVRADVEPLTRDLGAVPAGPGTPGTPGTTTDLRTPLPSTPVERVVAACTHAGSYFFPFVAPLLIFLVSDRYSPYVRRQAMEALNFQLFCLIAGVGGLLLFFLVLPFLVTLYAVVGALCLPAVASVAALRGKNWRYPMFLRLLKDD